MSASRRLRRQPVPPASPGGALILCARIGSVGNASVPPGTATGDCSQCGAAVWVSAAVGTLIRVSRTRPTFLCNVCVPPKALGAVIENR
jgi:hypothetical protein